MTCLLRTEGEPISELPGGSGAMALTRFVTPEICEVKAGGPATSAGLGLLPIAIAVLALPKNI